MLAKLETNLLQTVFSFLRADKRTLCSVRLVSSALNEQACRVLYARLTVTSTDDLSGVREALHSRNVRHFK